MSARPICLCGHERGHHKWNSGPCAYCREGDCSKFRFRTRTRSTSPATKGRGPVSLAKAGQRLDHGTRGRYVAGCRCDACRASNAHAARERVEKVRQAHADVVPSGPPIAGTLVRAGKLYQVSRCPGIFGKPCVVVGGTWLRNHKPVCNACVDRHVVWAGLVPARRARAHLLILRKRGIGRRSVHEACDVGVTLLQEIILGRQKKIRADIERRILAVDTGAARDRTIIAARPAQKAIAELLARGWTRTAIAKALGYAGHALHLKGPRITAKNALRVERLLRTMGRPSKVFMREWTAEDDAELAERREEIRQARAAD